MRRDDWDASDVLDCLRADVSVVDRDAKNRVASRLATSIAALPHDNASDVDDNCDVDSALDDASASPPAPSPARSLFHTRTSKSTPRASLGAKLGRGGSFLRQHIALSLAMFSVGTAFGAGVSAIALRESRVSAANSAASGMTSMTASPIAGTPLPPSSPEVAANLREGTPPLGATARSEAAGATLNAPPGKSARPRASATPLAGLAAQQALLDAARAALARGDDQAALRSVEVHARRYPDSIMAEEREALTIKALVGAGNYAEARVLGERFRTRYPQSLLLSSIEETLQTIP